MVPEATGGAMSPVLGKRILRQLAVLGSRYGLAGDGSALLEKAIAAGFYDDNVISGLIFCLANDNKPDKALDRFKEATESLGGAEKAPSTYLAGIYAYYRKERPDESLKMIRHFEETCVPYLKDDVRQNYIDFLTMMKEQL